jgi:hypothetical protein
MGYSNKICPQITVILHRGLLFNPSYDSGWNVYLKKLWLEIRLQGSNFGSQIHALYCQWRSLRICFINSYQMYDFAGHLYYAVYSPCQLCIAIQNNWVSRIFKDIFNSKKTLTNKKKYKTAFRNNKICKLLTAIIVLSNRVWNCNFNTLINMCVLYYQTLFWDNIINISTNYEIMINNGIYFMMPRGTYMPY